MYSDVPVTVGTKTGLRKKLMEFRSMASGALHPFIKEVLPVTGRSTDRMGFSNWALKMTLDAYSIRNYYPAMPRWDSLWMFYKKAHHQLAPLRVRELVAVMAVYTFMHTLEPFGICLIHDMAGSAEPRIIFSIIIEFVATKGGRTDEYKGYGHQYQRWDHGEQTSYPI